DRDFPTPEGISFATVDATSGGLATELCPKNTLVNEAFKAGTEPTVPCPTHRPAPVVIPLPEQPVEGVVPMSPGYNPTVLQPGETATLSPPSSPPIPTPPPSQPSAETSTGT
ncbi:MAG TPA: hypothetical protein VHL58_07355, partial [Thermoanaerobaculia bacterium]|nr:hypothetical protein [Thermoanaerobaculia bacterium]